MAYWFRMSSTCSSCSVIGTRVHPVHPPCRQLRSQQYGNKLNKHHKGFILRISRKGARILVSGSERALTMRLVRYRPAGQAPRSGGDYRRRGPGRCATSPEFGSSCEVLHVLVDNTDQAVCLASTNSRDRDVICPL